MDDETKELEFLNQQEVEEEPEVEDPGEEILALQEGETIFHSWGISKVKVTRGDKVFALRLAIKSSGVADLIDEFADREPKPPVVNVVVTPNSEIGKQLGLVRKRHVKTFDLTDKKYLETKRKHDRDLGMGILLMGLAVPIKNREGNEVKDPEEAIKILKSQGMSGEQFKRIIDDIQDLTRWEEDKTEDFFDVS